MNVGRAAGSRAHARLMSSRAQCATPSSGGRVSVSQYSYACATVAAGGVPVAM